MRLSGIFADYDGTLAPKDVTRAESKPLEGIVQSVDGIREHGKFAVVSTKDFWFLASRLPRVDAIGCVGGIEVVVGDRAWVRRGVLKKLERVCELLDASARMIADPEVVFEVKSLRNGMAAGLCIDWRHARPPAEDVVERIKEAAIGFGLYFEKYEHEPFLDVFPARPDKGAAVSFIKDFLRMDGPIMYIGDSRADNPAFRVADVSVGVVHGREAPALECQYFIRFEDVPRLLSELVNLGLDFDPSRLPLSRV